MGKDRRSTGWCSLPDLLDRGALPSFSPDRPSWRRREAKGPAVGLEIENRPRQPWAVAGPAKPASDCSPGEGACILRLSTKTRAEKRSSVANGHLERSTMARSEIQRAHYVTRRPTPARNYKNAAATDTNRDDGACSLGA